MSRTSTVSGLNALQVTETSNRQAFLANGTTLADTTVAEVASATGTLAATEDLDNAVLAATAECFGALAVIETVDNAVFDATAVTSGALTAQDDPDTAAVAGLVITVVSGTLAATESPDTAEVLTLGEAPVGALEATEAPDQAGFSGSLPEVDIPTIHFGGIGGSGRTERRLHALAQGVELTIALVLEPGRAYAAVQAVAQGASLVGVTPRSVTVLGDSLGARITLDQGYAFGVVDWSRYNEEFLLLVA